MKTHEEIIMQTIRKKEIEMDFVEVIKDQGCEKLARKVRERIKSEGINNGNIKRIELEYIDLVLKEVEKMLAKMNERIYKG